MLGLLLLAQSQSAPLPAFLPAPKVYVCRPAATPPRSVVDLLETVGTVTVRHDGKVSVKLGNELEFLDPPAGKDIDVQMVTDLRRMLANAGYSPR